jgi:hypothetical protein
MNARLLAGALSILLLPWSAMAQATAAQITGIIQDSQGGGCPRC